MVRAGKILFFVVILQKRREFLDIHYFEAFFVVVYEIGFERILLEILI